MDLNEENFFIKISVGHHGREALKGEFTSTSAMSSVVPGFCPEPIAWGTFESDQDIHFYMCKFYNFHNDGRMPNPESFCQNLANLHKKSESPNRKFGFDCTTYNGDLPQNNTWHDSWEAFFANGLRHILDVRKARAGPHPAELEKLLPTLFDVVIPRLLRPLESNGRKVKPSLVHGDLWYGNASVLVESDQAIVYDPASFYAHNECITSLISPTLAKSRRAGLKKNFHADELGNWLPPRNKFNKAYFDAYHSLVEKSEPKEDYDDRNSLYSLYVSSNSSINPVWTENSLRHSSTDGSTYMQLRFSQTMIAT